MKTLALSAALAIAVMGGAAAYAADSDTQYPGMYVKDSAITAKVKTKLLAKHITTLSDVTVSTDRDGNVWLGGKVPTRADRRRAEEIARDTDGVRSVHNDIVVSP
jgi:hyperosmotically inducible periplasmic protein